MRIAVFGAAGQVGSRLVREALRRSHEVTAVLRDPTRSTALPDGVDVRAGDAARGEEVAKAAADHDVLLAATRPRAGQEADLVTATRGLLAGAAATGTRVLVVGGAGSLTVPDSGALVVDDPRHLPPPARPIALACCDQLDVCRADPTADWTYLSPAATLAPGTRTGRYRLGRDALVVGPDGRSQISMEDLAVALLDEAERPRHPRTRFTVGY